MSYEDDYNDGEEAVAGQFNDARGQALRLNVLAERIIDSKISPFHINMDYGVMNYQLRITTLDSLWQEVRPKCKPKEIKSINDIKSLIESIQKVYPIIVDRNNGKSVDMENWERLDKLLIFYEQKIRKLQDVHQLGNPTKRPDIGL